mgnify:CR=1 FL=1
MSEKMQHYQKLAGKYLMDVSSVTEYIKRGLSYGDAIIVEALEQSDIETFITWNRKHLDGKLNIKLVTPEEYLKLHTN